MPCYTDADLDAENTYLYYGYIEDYIINAFVQWSVNQSSVLLSDEYIIDIHIYVRTTYAYKPLLLHVLHKDVDYSGI